MTWTSAFGNACGKLLRVIVNRMALAHISPNLLTFFGLLIDTLAAFLFGYANADNQARMFFFAGLVIFGAGFFDLVDGRVARASNQVTRFGAFFDSVVDRYSDAALFFGLLVYYSRGGRPFYVVLAALAMISSVMVSYTRARAESLLRHPDIQQRLAVLGLAISGTDTAETTAQFIRQQQASWRSLAQELDLRPE